MGKYASRDGGSSVAWVDITGKPATFTPAAHSNTAHSTEYAAVASPLFTGNPRVVGGSYLGFTWSAGDSTVYHKIGHGSASLPFDFVNNAGDADSDILHRFLTNAGGVANTAVGTITRGGNLVMSGVVLGAKLQTANWSLEEDANGNELHKYQGVLKWYVTPQGYMRTANDMEPKASMSI